MTTVALDCMGGDHGPREAVAGAAELSLSRQDIRLILVGDAPEIAGILDSYSYDPAGITIQHASQWVSQEENPALAIKEKPEASILIACRAVAEGRADALVTAGSTGAAILAADRCLGRIAGVRRAALAAVTPTRPGPPATAAGAAADRRDCS